MTSFSENDSLADTRAKVWRLLEKEERVKCPCCYQTARIYKNEIIASMAKGLISFYNSFGKNYGHVTDVSDPHFAHLAGRFAKMRWWGLIEAMPEGDGDPRGWWRVTNLGEDYILNGALVPEYVHTYSGNNTEPEGKMVGIQDALGKKFDLEKALSK